MTPESEPEDSFFYGFKTAKEIFHSCEKQKCNMERIEDLSHCDVRAEGMVISYG